MGLGGGCDILCHLYGMQDHIILRRGLICPKNTFQKSFFGYK